jgi:predicted nucleotidyltransferase
VVRRLFLFGSRARGDPHEFSDLRRHGYSG